MQVHNNAKFALHTDHAMNWIIAALLVLIIALLIKIIRDLRRLIEAGAYDGDTSALEDGVEALEEALELIESLDEEEREPTEAECDRLHDLLERAQAADLSLLTINPLLEAIQRLCPDHGHQE